MASREVPPGGPFPGRVGSFDDVVARFEASALSFTEREALEGSHWAHGEDARLREDGRFRPTPWGRYIPATALLANDALHAGFVRGLHSEVDLDTALAELGALTGRRCVFCPGDGRLVLQGGRVRLGAGELGTEPWLETDVPEDQRYRTHLPVHSLEAAAASVPAGEWGLRAQDEVIETLGWVRVWLPSGRQPNPRLFVARLSGHSMDDGRSGLTDGAWVVFELWPSGPVQNLRVLVRGAFTDPETGHYAVKKLVADSEPTGLTRVRLVSLNPDKERYPDIALDRALEEAVTVVAAVVPDLDRIRVFRRPRPVRRVGHRELHDVAARRGRVGRLTREVDRFFGPRTVTLAEGHAVPAPIARLVCLGLDAGGLCIEAGPLPWLPPLARTLRVESGAFTRDVLGSTLRSRVCRTPVAPSREVYRWSALGRESVISDELVGLDVAGLPDAVSLFRVDAAGVGQPLSGRTVSAGTTYRMLLPAGVPTPGAATALAGGWHFWEVQLPVSPAADLWEALIGLGLEVGRSAPRAEWVLRTPERYELTNRGESFPVFGPAGAILRVDGLPKTQNSEVLVFVVGREGATVLPLGAGERWVVALDELPPGQYLAEIVHERTQYAPARLAFGIAPLAPREVAARLAVAHERLSIEWVGPDGFVLEHDLTDLPTLATTAVTLPPLWPVRVAWDDGIRRHLGVFHAGEEGGFALDEVLARIQDAAQRCSIGTLRLDAGELGMVELRHRRRMSFDLCRTQITGLYDERRATLPVLAEQFVLLRRRWIEPLLRILGYEVEEPLEDDVADAPDRTTALRLVVSRREPERIRRAPAGGVVLVTPDRDLNAHDLFSARRYADGLCRRWNVERVFVTDGLRWLEHRRDRFTPRRPADLDTVLRGGDLLALGDFLDAYGAAPVEV